MRGGPLASKKNIAKVGAVLFAAGLPLGLFAGNAFADDNYGGVLDNTSTADAYVDQYTDVSTTQNAQANTGDNHAESGVLGENETEQDADASASEGNISAEDADDAIAGNAGGTNDQTSSSTNDGTSAATISTGPASATNTAATTVGQDNSGGASSTQGVTQADIDGAGNLYNSSSAILTVTQSATVGTSQSASANTGGNHAMSGVGGYNGTGQYANAAASGGNISGTDAAGATAGNTGGSNTQSSTSANTGNSTASVTTGAATSSNSSTTSVTQTNSGGASSSQTVDQSDIDD